MTKRDRTAQERGSESFSVTDRRFWAVDEDAEEKAEMPEERYPSFVEELKARTEAAESKLREKIEDLDQENVAFRDRMTRRMAQELSEGKAEVLRDLLEVVDNFERALDATEEQRDFDALFEGVRLNLNLMLTKLRNAGVEVIDLEGSEFDPALAEAVSVVAVDDPAQDNVVQEVIQKGYRLGDKVLRPALVTVGRHG